MTCTCGGQDDHLSFVKGRARWYASFLTGGPVAPKLSQCSFLRFTPTGTRLIESGLGVCMTLGYVKEMAWRTCLAAQSIARYGSQYFTMASRNCSNCTEINFSCSANDNTTHHIR